MSGLDLAGLDKQGVDQGGLGLPPGLRRAAASGDPARLPMLPRFGKGGGSRADDDDKKLPPGLRGGAGRAGRKGR
jgi:hypothetical protein